jgi:phenylalanyl-tRNA synthetase alpha chain
MEHEFHEYEIAVLPHLATCGSVEEVVRKSGLEHIMVMRALQWLSNKEIVTVTFSQKTMIDLDENGLVNKEKGFPEKRLLLALKKGSATMQRLEASGLNAQEIGVAIGTLRRHNAITTENEKGVLTLTITEQGEKIADTPTSEEHFLHKQFPLEESSLSAQERTVYESLKTRKRVLKVETRQIPHFTLTTQGTAIIKKGVKQSSAISRLTGAMLRDGSWKSAHFRKYDVDLKVPKVYGGRRHPLVAVNDMIRSIFIEMGFVEMRGPWVETAFWCLDSMWVPQDHPAREVQDTFYLPYKGKLPDARLVQKVKEVHETGAKTGSKGYGYTWNPEIASQLLLRTHTTATTYRYFGLHEIAKKERAKYFYIGRVFRNEAIDATHLPEFHQVEGFVMDEGLTIQHLMAFIKAFYAKMGIHEIKFKLTYNPYTESSLEALYYDKKRGKWLELINSGMFRPESLAPYGITKPVIAWGLGVERLAMTLYKLNKLKDLLGPGCDLDWIRNYETIVRKD